MKLILEYLDSIKNIVTTLYYPGAGNDFNTLKLFVENSSINEVYFINALCSIWIWFCQKKLFKSKV